MMSAPVNIYTAYTDKGSKIVIRLTPNDKTPEEVAAARKFLEEGGMPEPVFV